MGYRQSWLEFLYAICTRPLKWSAVKDIERAGRLIAEFISGLELDFVSKISWEDEDAK